MVQRWWDRAWWAVLVTVLAPGAPLGAAVVVLPAVDAAYIESPGQPSDGRYLTRFELSDEVSRGRVDLAVLELRVSVRCPDGADAIMLDALPVVAEWSGGSVGWSEGWTTPGGDFDAWPHGAWMAGEGDGLLVRFDVTSLVSAWASGERENLGVIVMAALGEPCALGPSTVEPGQDQPPVLTIRFKAADAR